MTRASLWRAAGVIMRAVRHTATLNRDRLVAMVVVDSQVNPFDLDALAVSDRFRLSGFTRRDDYLAYLCVLRAIDRPRRATAAGLPYGYARS